MTFQLIECLRFEGGYQRLDQHLARLQASSTALGFVCLLEPIKLALNDLAATLQYPQIYKIKLLLQKSGAIELTAEPIASPLEPVFISMVNTRIDTHSLLFQHKTTSAVVRGVYQQAWQERIDANAYFDLIFCNQCGEVTEGSRSNIFIEKAGHWYTPPISCGVLPGVMRAQVIQEYGVQEQILTVDDLQKAERIWVSNSVRGLLRATLAQ